MAPTMKLAMCVNMSLPMVSRLNQRDVDAADGDEEDEDGNEDTGARLTSSQAALMSLFTLLIS